MKCDRCDGSGRWSVMYPGSRTTGACSSCNGTGRATQYRVLVADPPWEFGDDLPGKGRGSAKHYPCMGMSELMEFRRYLPRPEPDDCVLFMWRVAAMQWEALNVISAWGFIVKTELVWLKRTATGKRHLGMGRTLRAEHETCLVATRGRMPPKVRNIRSTFEAPVGRHSAKPDAFYDLVEQLYDGPYLELFARRQRPGWTCLGNEMPTTEAA